MALPFFNSLRQLYPDSKIIAICKSDVAPIFEEYPSISGIIQFEKKDLSGFRATSISGISLRSIDLDIFYLLVSVFQDVVASEDWERISGRDTFCHAKPTRRNSTSRTHSNVPLSLVINYLNFCTVYSRT